MSHRNCWPFSHETQSTGYSGWVCHRLYAEPAINSHVLYISFQQVVHIVFENFILGHPMCIGRGDVRMPVTRQETRAMLGHGLPNWLLTSWQFLEEGLHVEPSRLTVVRSD